MVRSRLTAVLLFVFIAAAAACRAQPQPDAKAPLVAYVTRPDAAYAWSKVDEFTLPLSGSTCVRLEMTSQVWQGIPWKHDVAIIRPKKAVVTDTVVLLITGGKADAGTLSGLGVAVEQIGMPVAILFGIPNQPLFDGKREDSLIAYTFVQYLKSGDATWPLLFPMVKSALRAMDSIQKLAETEWKAPAAHFVVAGASKRGWTTWLTGVVDRRVCGIIPIVYDNLNLPAQMAQQLAYYATYSEKIGDYTAQELPQLLASPDGKRLAGMVDPYAFRETLTMPKLILCGSNDPYWTLDSAGLYFNDLPGDKQIFYVPNAGHNAGMQTEPLASIGAFARACAAGKTLPKITWSYADEPAGLRLTIRPPEGAASVSVWTATSDSKDFRKATWTEHIVTAENGVYTYHLARSATGFAGIFGQARLRAGDQDFWVSTVPRIAGAK